MCDRWYELCQDRKAWLHLCCFHCKTCVNLHVVSPGNLCLVGRMTTLRDSNLKHLQGGKRINLWPGAQQEEELCSPTLSTHTLQDGQLLLLYRLV